MFTGAFGTNLASFQCDYGLSAIARWYRLFLVPRALHLLFIWPGSGYFGLISPFITAVQRCIVLPALLPFGDEFLSHNRTAHCLAKLFLP